MDKPEDLDKMFDKLTTKQKLILMAEKLIGMMIKRTQKGFGVDGTFAPYSNKSKSPYWRRKQQGKFKRQATEFKPSSSTDVNLTLTSDMLNSLKVKKGGTNNMQVTIGMPPQQAVKANRQEKLGRAISTVENPVTDMEEKFIAEFFDKEIKKAFKKASGETTIVIG